MGNEFDKGDLESVSCIHKELMMLIQIYLVFVSLALLASSLAPNWSLFQRTIAIGSDNISEILIDFKIKLKIKMFWINDLKCGSVCCLNMSEYSRKT